MMWFYDLRNIYTLKCFTVLNIRKDIPSSTLLAKKKKKKKTTKKQKTKKNPGNLAGLHYLYLFGDTVIFCSSSFNSYNQLLFFLITCQLKNKALSCPTPSRCNCIFALFFLRKQFLPCML